MINSILISGGTKEERLKKIEETIGNKMTEEHPEIKIVSVVDKKKQISISQIRELESFLSKKARGTAHNSVVIMDAHLMNESAQNALLKTLEEPPTNSKIILETQNEFSLLPTIRSRCLKVVLPQKDLVTTSSTEHKDFAREFIQLLETGPAKRIEFLESKKQIFTREATSQFLSSAVSVLSDLLVLYFGGDNFANKGLTPELKKCALPPQRIVGMIENLEKTRNEIEKTNVNFKHALTVAILGL